MVRQNMEKTILNAIKAKDDWFTTTDIYLSCMPISRSTVYLCLQALVRNGELKRSGTGRGTRYIRSDRFEV